MATAGPERGVDSPRYRRLRALAPVIAVALFLLVALLIRTLGVIPPAATPPPRTSATATSTSRTGLPAAPPAARSGIALVVPSSPPMLVDLDHRSKAPLPGIAPGSARWIFDTIPVGRSVVITARPAYEGSGPNPDTSVYVLAPGATSAVRIASTGAAAASADDTGLWLTRPAAGAAGRQLVQEVDLGGHPRAPAIPLPVGRFVVRGTVAGLLTSVDQGTDTAWQVWEPRTGVIVLRIPQLLGATATQLAWGDYSATLRITDLRRLSTRTVPMPREVAGAVADTRFSPDGRYLAVLATTESSGGVVADLWVLDLAAMRWQRMPGLPSRTSSLLGMAWSPDGASLVITTTQLPANRIVVWQPARRTVSAVPVTVPRTGLALATLATLAVVPGSGSRAPPPG